MTFSYKTHSLFVLSESCPMATGILLQQIKPLWMAHADQNETFSIIFYCWYDGITCSKADGTLYQRCFGDKVKKRAPIQVH